MMHNSYTVATASSFAGVDRKTVLNALKNEALTASKTTKNHWVISHNNLKKWMKSRGKSHSPRKPVTTITSKSSGKQFTITSEVSEPLKVAEDRMSLSLLRADVINLKNIIIDNIAFVDGSKNPHSRDDIDFSDVEHMEFLFTQAKLLKYITDQLETIEPEDA